MADVDNDGWPDVYTTDMLPEDEVPLKDDHAVRGLGHVPDQGPEWPASPVHAQHAAAEQSRRARSATSVRWPALARTDWSWSALIADLDLDGNKGDIFVTKRPREGHHLSGLRGVPRERGDHEGGHEHGRFRRSISSS